MDCRKSVSLIFSIDLGRIASSLRFIIDTNSVGHNLSIDNQNKRNLSD